MRTIFAALTAVALVTAGSAARAECPDGGVVRCSRTELRVASCKPFAIDQDEWIRKDIEKRSKGDAAAAAKIRAAYQGTIVTGTVQASSPGLCDGSHAVLHATTEHGAPPSWFTTEDCAGFKAGDTVTVETPSACCTGGDDVPCLFIEKARATTKPVLPGPSRLPPSTK